MGQQARAARSLAWLTRTGSSSTRLSPRGHGFEFSTWDDADSEPAPAPPPPKPPEQVDAQQRQLVHNAQVAARARKDLAWFKERLRIVREVAFAGDAAGAAYLCETLGGLPNDLAPGSNPVVAAAWVRANMRDKYEFKCLTMSEALVRALDSFERLTSGDADA